MRCLRLLVAAATLVGISAKGCQPVTCSGESISDHAAVMNDMGNMAYNDLIMKSSYEHWSINELVMLKSGTWPEAGGTCTAGAGCASDDMVAAACSKGASAIEIAKLELQMSVAQINAVCGFAGGKDKKKDKKKKKKKK
mmetsp:Transcript_33930/g.58227  ORF Transcript_33930/g.58227 Transcript_33930/m.58227 type:complete len:139 (+) Transcript_33930:62-478(+)|eukprot:CAMPEP_0205926926 /NCGR_PEP_ID=MMETSP1325-20131115/21498_1 /ASSEMBLY_ACC=CAM_ASM_000708 /TAXON_ID=236786 /ORGANISM="Florenciella sp., Strain RCC1007" /LENGTH=138 /DNA_ID=CAMNT_0053295721 /DNA_START=62 /DNA_END=478 /DNA_ORIENTATION=-